MTLQEEAIALESTVNAVRRYCAMGWDATDYHTDGYVYVSIERRDGSGPEDPVTAARDMVAPQWLDGAGMTEHSRDQRALRLLTAALETCTRTLWPGCTVMLVGPDELGGTD